MWAVAGYTKYGSIGWGPRGVDPDRRMVDCEDVSCTVIKPIMADQAEVHVEEAVMTVKCKDVRVPVPPRLVDGYGRVEPWYGEF